jgi:3-dehydroquinate dehydratase / shikimate dehydrogenase
MIIASIVGPGHRDALRQIAQVSGVADMLELRLDLIGPGNLQRVVAGAAGLPVIGTCRPVREGGTYSGPEEHRLEVLREAVTCGISYVDIEVDVFVSKRLIFNTLSPSLKVICSHHLRIGERIDVRREFRRLVRHGPDVVKFAYHATDSHECRFVFEFLDLARAEGVRAIAIAMGPAGEATRILYRKFGGWATFASSGGGKESAPGQLSAADLKGVFRANRLNRRTRVYGLVGNPVHQSKGTYLHNGQFERSQVNAVYCRFLTTDLGKFVRHIAPVLHGMSVTIPHKERMVRYLDLRDSRVRATGAVNTVLCRRGLLAGSNTDAAAALETIEKVLRVSGKAVMVVGAGGAARAVAYEARVRGAAVTVAGRTDARARALARQLRVSWIPWDRFRRARGRVADVVVNTTPVGMAPHTRKSAVPRAICGGIVAADAIYNPPLTRFLREARAMGSRTVSGMEWFIAQALLQSRAFGVPEPDRALMRRIFERRWRTP